VAPDEIAVFAAAGIHANRAAHRCTDNGGRWVRENCREVEEQLCTVVDTNNMLTACVPMTSTVCYTGCRGPSAEGRP
jgi:hypothetical protein